MTTAPTLSQLIASLESAQNALAPILDLVAADVVKVDAAQAALDTVRAQLTTDSMPLPNAVAFMAAAADALNQYLQLRTEGPALDPPDPEISPISVSPVGPSTDPQNKQ